MLVSAYTVNSCTVSFLRCTSIIVRDAPFILRLFNISGYFLLKTVLDYQFGVNIIVVRML